MKSAHFFGHFIFLVYFCTTQQGNCCCSSVVEHFLGKEEVTSSSLVNSSIFEEAVLSGRMAPLCVSSPASGEGPPFRENKNPNRTSADAPIGFGIRPIQLWNRPGSERLQSKQNGRFRTIKQKPCILLTICFCFPLRYGLKIRIPWLPYTESPSLPIAIHW